MRGTGFGSGEEATLFKFGTIEATTVHCGGGECFVLVPPHAAGTLDVKATMNGQVSPKNAPADQYTYN